MVHTSHLPISSRDFRRSRSSRSLDPHKSARTSATDVGHCPCAFQRSSVRGSSQFQPRRYPPTYVSRFCIDLIGRSRRHRRSPFSVFSAVKILCTQFLAYLLFLLGCLLCAVHQLHILWSRLAETTFERVLQTAARTPLLVSYIVRVERREIEQIQRRTAIRTWPDLTPRGFLQVHGTAATKRYDKCALLCWL